MSAHVMEDGTELLALNVSFQLYSWLLFAGKVQQKYIMNASFTYVVANL